MKVKGPEHKFFIFMVQIRQVIQIVIASLIDTRVAPTCPVADGPVHLDQHVAGTGTLSTRTFE